MSEYVDEEFPEEAEPEIVHWMEPRPLSVGAGGISATAAGAFVLGAAATLTVLALMRWLGPEREVALRPVGRR
jgi:hypothetical protein